MTINYNVTGTERKRLADYISGFMGTEKKYLGAPTFAYQIGYLTVSKDGAVSFEDRGYNSDIDALMAELEGQGFHTEDTTTKADTTADTAEPEATSGERRPAGRGQRQHRAGDRSRRGWRHPAPRLRPDGQPPRRQPALRGAGQPHQPPHRQGAAHPQGPGCGSPPGGGQPRHGFLPLVRGPGPRR